MRHCEPPLHEWQELLNANKGAWQSAFSFLSRSDTKPKMQIATPFCRTEFMPNDQGITAKRLAMTRLLPSSCNSLTPCPPLKRGLEVPSCGGIRELRNSDSEIVLLSPHSAVYDDGLDDNRTVTMSLFCEEFYLRIGTVVVVETLRSLRSTLCVTSFMMTGQHTEKENMVLTKYTVCLFVQDDQPPFIRKVKKTTG